MQVSEKNYKFKNALEDAEMELGVMEEQKNNKNNVVQQVDSNRNTQVSLESNKFKGVQSNLEEQSEESQEFRQLILPKKVIVMTVALTIFGVLFTIVGLIDLIVDISTDFHRAIALFVIGILFLIPGSYYSVQLYHYYKATNPQQKQIILNEFPIE